MASLTTIAGFLGSVAVAGLSINSTITNNADAIAVPGWVVSAPATKPRVVNVTGEDFKFDAPDIIPAGLTEFRFLNKGPALQHMTIIKLGAGKTVDDLRAAFADPGQPPSWVKFLGGPNASDPGVEGNATIMMEPGNYALVCFVDIGGPPHFAKGMVRALHVVPAKNTAAKPKADLSVTLTDYNFKLSSPIRAGTRTLRVHNVAKQDHELQLLQLAAGKTLGDLMAWLSKMEGPPPGKALGGVAGMSPGVSEYFTATFSSGSKYVFICLISDAKDGKPHFAHGMAQQITVN
jgi:hypothetical protein